MWKQTYEVWYQRKNMSLGYILVKALSFEEAREKARKRIVSPLVDCRKHNA